MKGCAALGQTNTGKNLSRRRKGSCRQKLVFTIAPLRLLALETLTIAEPGGRACNLVTGDEEILVETQGMVCRP
jgi:hypothetical protein